MPRRRAVLHALLLAPVMFLLTGAAPASKPAAAADDPGPALLKAFAGVWNATMQIASPDDSPPLVLNGIEVNTLGAGGVWVTSDFRSQMDNRPFQGQAVLSWNRAAGRFRRVWADATSPTFWLSEGTWDPATRTLTLWVETVNSSGAPVRWHEETVFKDDDTRTYTMYVPGAHAEAAAITITYRRRKEGAPRPQILAVPSPPTPGHAVVLRDAGAWTTQMLNRPLPGGGSSTARGRETDTVCCDGNFLITDYVGDPKKDPFAAHSILGYDPDRKRYLMATVDTADTTLTIREGEFDAATDALTFRYDTTNRDGKTIPARAVMQWKGPDQRSLTVIAPAADGKDQTGMTVKFRRSHESGPAEPR